MPMSKEKKAEWERKNRSGKVRKIWWGYLYEDSAPDNFLDLMRESGMEGLAMKHDRDVTAAGEIKEKHWHVVVRFSHAVQAKEAKDILTSFGCKEASVQYRDNWTAVARYLCHWMTRTRCSMTPPMLSSSVARITSRPSTERRTSIESLRRCATGQRPIAYTASTSSLITPALKTSNGSWRLRITARFSCASI